jgi:hypothetical protein
MSEPDQPPLKSETVPSTQGEIQETAGTSASLMHNTAAPCNAFKQDEHMSINADKAPPPALLVGNLFGAKFTDADPKEGGEISNLSTFKLRHYETDRITR